MIGHGRSGLRGRARTRELLCSVPWRTGMRWWSGGIGHSGLQTSVMVSSSHEWIKEPPLMGQDAQLEARLCVSPCDRLLPRCRLCNGHWTAALADPGTGLRTVKPPPALQRSPLIVIRAKGPRAAMA